MSKKILVQFDGSNFYNKVKEIVPNSHLTNFDYAGFVKSITKNNSGQIVYYVGEIRKYPGNRKSQTLYANQQSLFSHLRKQNIKIKLGYLLMNDGVYREKGVDVQIAVDMVWGALKKEYQTCFLISSDTDLIPAIKAAKSAGRQIVYVGFEDSISQGLAKNCSSYYKLKKHLINEFMRKK